MKVFRGGKTIYIGQGHTTEIFRDSKRVFVICDPFLKETGKIKYLTDDLDNLSIAYEIYAEIGPDPTIDMVSKGIEALSSFMPDTIVGFGGGSAIDAGKAMMYFAEKAGIISVAKLVAVPTTSGTGSEVTDFSVITDPEKEQKYPLVDKSLLPGAALLDAELTLTVPPGVTAATGMDVLTHAIEAMVSTEANDFSDAAAEKAIKLVRSNLLVAYKDPNNREARQAMHNASCLAGIAFNNSGLGLNHGMAHSLGARFHIPHGLANAVLLPYVMGFNAGCFDSLTSHAGAYARIARLIRVDSGSIRQSSLNLIRAVKKFNEALSIPSRIMDFGIKKEDFKAELEEMIEGAYKDVCTKTNPRKCSKEDIRKIYIHAFFGNVGKNL